MIKSKRKEGIIKRYINNWYNSADTDQKELFQNLNYNINGLIEDLENDCNKFNIAINYNNIVELLSTYIYD